MDEPVKKFSQRSGWWEAELARTSRTEIGCATARKVDAVLFTDFE